MYEFYKPETQKRDGNNSTKLDLILIIYRILFYNEV